MGSVTGAERAGCPLIEAAKSATIPIQADEKSSGNVCALRRVRETARGHFSLVIGGVL